MKYYSLTHSFKSLCLLFLVLSLGIDSVWANHMTDMSDDEAITKGFWARLIAKPAATTGGTGLVFVSEDYHSVTPTDEDYKTTHFADGYSDVYVQTSLIDCKVAFHTYAKADPGSYFKGWSFADGATDLGDYDDASSFSMEVLPSNKRGKVNVKEYTVYAAFEAIKIVSYTISGNSTTDNGTCTQTVTFRAECPGAWALSSGDDVRHFKLPAITPKTGTAGNWTTSITAWNTQNIEFKGDCALIKVPVTFTAPNLDPSEYGAELVLETYAGVKMKVYLSARTVGESTKDLSLYDGKEYKDAINVADLGTFDFSGYSNPIVKLNKDYNNSLTIDKKITFDLNGYKLNNTLTLSGNDVVLAYSPFGGSVNSVIVSGKAILNGGSVGMLTISSGANVEQHGATITGAVNNNGTMTTTDGSISGHLTSSGTLIINGGTFTNASGVAIDVTGGTAQIKKGTITGATYGVQTNGNEVSATIEKLAKIEGGTKALNGIRGSLIVNNGRFTDPANLKDGSVTFNAGYFQTVSDPAILGKQVWRNTAGAEAREGYEFFVGDQNAAQASNVSVCRIGSTAYSSLEEALAYANNNAEKTVIIIMENDYVLPAGYYTLPKNATLIVPMSNEQQVDNPIVPREKSSPYIRPVSFRKLKFADGVNFILNGTMELTCSQYGEGTTMGVPGGNYGHLILQSGSHITISSGGELRAWGYVSGDGTKDAEGNYLSGEIDARRGSIVREMFQMGDWKGGDISFTMAMEIPGMNPTWRDITHLFPIYTYFIQNIESPVKYHPGSSLICATSVNVLGNINAYANDIKIVGKNGEAAMFLMDEMADSENTWVRKFYDAKNDKQVYEVNSGAQLGSVVIELGDIEFPGLGSLKLELDSRKFVLPLTNNFKIHLLSGNMQFTQSTSCLPGMEVEIDKESEISIINLGRDDVVEGALYLYDADQWSFANNQKKGYVNGGFGSIVLYSAIWDIDPSKPYKPNKRDISSPATIGDAVLNVHGTFRMGENCAVYTTWSKNLNTLGLDESETASGGASIISTNADAGTFIFDADAPTFQGLIFDKSDPENPKIAGFYPDVLVNYEHNDLGLDGKGYPVKVTTVYKKEEWRTYGFDFCTSAKLKNGSGAENEFAETAGTSAGKSYCYMNNKWTLLDVDPDNECFMIDQDGIYYAKPAEYVALANGKVENADHTYSDKATEKRLFILMSDNCQWWEVEKKDNLYHCIHPQNDTYYHWVGDAPDPYDPEYIIPGHWEEQRFNISWKNWDGEPIKTVNEYGDEGDTYSVPYGTMAEFLGTNPTREATNDYTYDFTGWSPALGPVTSDVTYTATYEPKPRKYTIIFQQEGGVEIERQFLTLNEVPVCENTPTKVGHTLVWSPAIAAVTGDATYTATWEENPPTHYQIAFLDHQGDTLKKEIVQVGGMPTPPVIEDGKPVCDGGCESGKTSSTGEFTYVFDHWSPQPEVVSATSIKSFKAVYKEVPVTYTIRYYKEDKSTPNPTKPLEILPYGATPTPPIVSKENPDPNKTYTLVWKDVDENNNIETVRRDAKYYPVYVVEENRYKRYTVTLSVADPATCEFLGAGTYDEGAEVTMQAIPTEGYEFVKWSDDETNATHSKIIVSDDVTFTASVRKVVMDKTVAIGDVPFDGTGKTVKNLTLQSNGTASGQIFNADKLTLEGNAYFDLILNATAETWYAFGLPWQVNTNGGISADGRTLVLQNNCYLLEFDGELAAKGDLDSETQSTWHYVKSGILQPGKLYMIYLRYAASTIRFAKQSEAKIDNRAIELHRYASTDPAKAGWNAIANPTTAYTKLTNTVFPAKGQVYVPGKPDANGNNGDRYDAITLASNQLIVGQPLFVQVVVAGDEKVETNASNIFAAPRRTVNTSDEYEIRIAPAEGNFTDRLYISSADDKEDRYIIGQDLSKISIATGVAQMWINRYDTKLCANVTEVMNDQAVFPMGIYAPKDGQYTLSTVSTIADNEELYVTIDGTPVWDLSAGVYTIDLQKGNTSEYGLVIVRRPAPEVTTGCQNVEASENASVRKVLINGQVFILRDGAVYTIFGQKAK